MKNRIFNVMSVSWLVQLLFYTLQKQEYNRLFNTFLLVILFCFSLAIADTDQLTTDLDTTTKVDTEAEVNSLDLTSF